VDAAAAIVPDHSELVEAEMLHDFDAVKSHRPFGVIGAIAAALRRTGIALAAQVAHHERIFLRKLGRDESPRDQ
jgi:hypothetical protein